MAEVTLDTSFLITLADNQREHHAVAVNYFRHCVVHNVPMYVSAIAAGEFAVKQPLTDLPLQNFRLRAYDLVQAQRSALLYNLNRQYQPAVPDGPRNCVINDLKILAQAVEDEVSVLLTEDRNTLAKIAQRLCDEGLITLRVVLLKDGFEPRKLEQLTEGEFDFVPPEDEPS